MKTYEPVNAIQSFLLRLISQNPEFFYEYREQLLPTLVKKLSQIPVSKAEVARNRDLVITILSQLTAYLKKEAQENDMRFNKKEWSILISQIYSRSCILLYISSFFPEEQGNCQRCCSILKQVLTFGTETPFFFRSIDKINPTSKPTLLTNQDVKSSIRVSIFICRYQ